MGPSSFLDEWNRYKLLNAKFQVRARGISNQMEKEDQLQKLMQLSTTAQMLQMPFDVQGKIFFRTAEAMMIDPRELNAPADEAEWQAFTQKMMAQQQMAGGPGSRLEWRTDGVARAPFVAVWPPVLPAPSRSPTR